MRHTDLTDDQFVTALFGGMTLGIFFFIMLMAVAVIAVAILYFSLLHKTMNRVSEANRPVPGGLVWLGFVPVLGPLWVLVFQLLLSAAIKKDFASAGRPSDGALPIAIGLAVCTALIVVPVVNAIAALVHVVLWIVYWVRISALKDQMPVSGVVYSRIPPRF